MACFTHGLLLLLAATPDAGPRRDAGIPLWAPQLRPDNMLEGSYGLRRWGEVKARTAIAVNAIITPLFGLIVYSLLGCLPVKSYSFSSTNGRRRQGMTNSHGQAIVFAIMALMACQPPALSLDHSDAGDASHPACPECDEHAWCARSAETVVCTCRDGFTGDGHTCVDIDECAQDTAPCDHQNGICTNTNGGYACSCAAGWNLGSDGVTCVEAFKAVQVVAGGDHSCAIKRDNTLACWGDNAYGQSTPPSGTFLQVSAGYLHTCGVRTDGTAACWGLDEGDGRTAPRSGPFVQVSAGAFHTCGVKTDGTVACWGDNAYGQSLPPAGTFVQVAAGYAHTCGLRTDGTVACWESDKYGESTSPADTFVQVTAGGDFDLNRIYFGHTCGVRTDGTVACWGDNAYGQSRSPLGAFMQVAAAFDFTCGLHADGTVICWGCDDCVAGFLTPPSGTFVQVAAGGGHACALKADGTVTCWGSTFYGESTPPASD